MAAVVEHTHARIWPPRSMPLFQWSSVQNYIMETMYHVSRIFSCSLSQLRHRIDRFDRAFLPRPQTCYAKVNTIFTIGQTHRQTEKDRQARARVSGLCILRAFSEVCIALRVVSKDKVGFGFWMSHSRTAANATLSRCGQTLDQSISNTKTNLWERKLFEWHWRSALINGRHATRCSLLELILSRIMVSFPEITTWKSLQQGMVMEARIL